MSDVLAALDRHAEAAQAATEALTLLLPFVERYPETFGDLGAHDRRLMSGGTAKQRDESRTWRCSRAPHTHWTKARRVRNSVWRRAKRATTRVAPTQLRGMRNAIGATLVVARFSVFLDHPPPPMLPILPSQGGNAWTSDFIGLGRMGFHMARRLVEAGHRLTVYDTRPEAVARLIARGADAAASPRDVADRTETVLASLPTPDIVLTVATGDDGVIEGSKVRRFVDLSTTGSRMAMRVAEALQTRNIVQLDSPVSGGVGGAEKGTLAVMVSGPRAEFDRLAPRCWA